MAHIEAVAFDVDGTLYSNRRLYLHSLGFALRHARFIYHFNQIRRGMRSSPQNHTGYADLYQHQALHLAQQLKLPLTEARKAIERIIYEKWMEQISRQPLHHGLRELLKELQQRKIPLALMSDFPISRKLQQWGIGEYFQHIIECERRGMLKPAPPLFYLLAEQLQQPPANILYVGNSGEYDIAAAAAIGMPSAYLSERGRHHPLALFNFKKYEDLAQFLARSIAS